MEFSKFEQSIIDKAKKKCLTIVLPETEMCDRIQEAAKFCHKNKIANIITINNQKLADELKTTNYNIVEDDRFNAFANELYEIRKNKGMTIEKAKETLKDPFFYAAFLLKNNLAHTVVGGSVTSTAKVLLPAFQVIGSKGKRASSSFVLEGDKSFGDNGFLLLGDCAVNVQPDADTLSEIAEHCVDTATKLLGFNPRVAFLSYSTEGSAGGEQVDLVKSAVEKFRQNNSGVLCDGDIQADAALYPETALVKMKNSNNKGKSNILIFPDLQSGNIGYKLMRYAGNLRAYGPIVQGLKKPFCDLSRSSSVKEIIITVAISSLLCDNV